MKRIVTLALLAALTFLAAAPGQLEARRRRSAATPDEDRPVTRTEMAQALEPVLEKRLTANGRAISGQDVANLETLTIESADEMAATSSRVERLQEEIERLREEIQQLRRRRRR